MITKTLEKGSSLKEFAGVSFENPTKAIIDDYWEILIISINSEDATVLYRERKYGNLPSKGHLQLSDYILVRDGIWSYDNHDIQDLGEEWDQKLNVAGILR